MVLALFEGVLGLECPLQDNHSVIIGPIGSGKSALFKLLKEKSTLLKEYNDYIVVPIQENISFFELKTFLNTISPNKEEKYLYQFMWKFQITLKLAETLYDLNPTLPSISQKPPCIRYFSRL